jgi:hypothetical protein
MRKFDDYLIDEFSDHADAVGRELYCRQCSKKFVQQAISFSNVMKHSPVVCSVECNEKLVAAHRAGAPARLAAFLAKLTPEQRTKYEGAQPVPASQKEAFEERQASLPENAEIDTKRQQSYDN